MSHRRFILSYEGEKRLNKALAEFKLKSLEICKRPEVFRLAFAKGLTAVPSLPEEVKRGKGKFEIGEGVVATGDEYLLFKHLIIQKAKRPLDKKEVDDYMLYLIEEGLKIMEREIDSLSELDNYLIYLVNSPGEQNP